MSVLTPKLKKRLFTLVLTLVLLGISILSALLGINAYVTASTKDRILTSGEAASLEEVDCILVLGCLVKQDGVPSDMLADRLTRGVELYEMGAAPKLLMSGDHHTVPYNEVQAMKDFATEHGIASEDVFMDHAGLNTYDSLWRAKEVFGVDKVIIVSQEYHLHRALHIADRLGIDAYGVSADYHTYFGQFMRDAREVLARNKDFALSIIRPEATIGGEPISLLGSGDVTND